MELQGYSKAAQSGELWPRDTSASQRVIQCECMIYNDE